MTPVSGVEGMAAVLVVDDDPVLARTTERLLSKEGHRVTTLLGAREAIAAARATRFDVIVSDVSMPDIDGKALLRAIRAADLDVPFVFMTGQPELQGAIEAVEYGAFRYLIKPVPPGELREVVKRAIHWHRLALVRREAARSLDGRTIADRAGLDARFESALTSLWIATQPIVSCAHGTVLAYEALVRTEEPSLRTPPDLLAAALLPAAPDSALLFVNLHPSDLEDDELCAPDGALTPFARRVVLEVTERTALESIRGLRGRVDRLREVGFRIAVDDLGAGYAGLSSFAALEPDVVKADMSLVRGIEASPVKQKLLGAIAALAKDLRVQLVAEGVETAAEYACVSSLGADAVQGYFFARPGRGFPSVTNEVSRILANQT